MEGLISLAVIAYLVGSVVLAVFRKAQSGLPPRGGLPRPGGGMRPAERTPAPVLPSPAETEEVWRGASSSSEERLSSDEREGPADTPVGEGLERLHSGLEPELRAADRMERTEGEGVSLEGTSSEWGKEEEAWHEGMLQVERGKDVAPIFRLVLHPESLWAGVVFGEILGPPRSRKPFGGSRWPSSHV